MRGDARVRFCDQCRKHVYDLSAMTAEAAVALIGKTEGSVCVRLWRRADGTVITADCPVGARRARRRSRLRLPAALLAGLALQVACAKPRPAPPRPAACGAKTQVQGEVEVGYVATSRAFSQEPGSFVYGMDDLEHLPIR